MLSRKLLSIVTAGMLSVAVVPATWGRTHARSLANSQKSAHPLTAAKPVTTVAPKVAVLHAPKAPLASAGRMPARKLSAHSRPVNRVASRRLSHRATTVTKLSSAKSAVRRGTKLSTARHTATRLTAARPIKHPVLNTAKAAPRKVTISKRPAGKLPM